MDYLRTRNQIGERWPVVRSGQRTPVRWAKRVAILKRDKYTCQVCRRKGANENMELDHIVPWSAGGADVSENLRTLCIDCNQKRSNANDGAELLYVRPVTLWCVTCWPEGEYLPHCPSFSHTHSMSMCPYEREAFAVWHRIPEYAETVAFCGHCGRYSETDVTL